MFFKKEEKIIGAADKIATAERMRQAALEEEEKKFGIRHESQALPIVLIFVLAVVFQFLRINPTTVLGPSPSLGVILFGAGIPSFTGTPDTDRAIIVLIRGLATFLLAGFIPLLAKVIVQVVGKRRITAYVACWAALVLVPLLLYALRGVIGPVLGSM